MGLPKYKAFTAKLLKRLRKHAPMIEWSATVQPVRGRQTLIIEAYYPPTEQAVGISLGQKPTTQDRAKLIDTILSQAQTLLPDQPEETLLEQVFNEMDRRK